LPLYRKYAQVTIDCPGKTHEQFAEEIIRKTTWAASQPPCLGESLEAAVISSFDIRPKTAARQLLRRQMIAQTLAAQTLSAAARVRTRTNLQVLFFPALHLQQYLPATIFPKNSANSRIIGPLTRSATQ
jgi:hypothetical protein